MYGDWIQDTLSSSDERRELNIIKYYLKECKIVQERITPNKPQTDPTCTCGSVTRGYIPFPEINNVKVAWVAGGRLSETNLCCHGYSSVP